MFFVAAQLLGFPGGHFGIPSHFEEKNNFLSIRRVAPLPPFSLIQLSPSRLGQNTPSSNTGPAASFLSFPVNANFSVPCIGSIRTPRPPDPHLLNPDSCLQRNGQKREIVYHGSESIL